MRSAHVARLTLEYDGREFAGWGLQPGRRTVQQELERALATVVLRDPGGRVPVVVAGRTDAGVHAWAQVVSYDGPPVSPQRLNALLPHDVAVLSAETAPPGFNARYDATSRAYCYRVLTRATRSAHERGRALWWPRPVDVDALHACAAVLAAGSGSLSSGAVHDFTAFTPTGARHVHFRREVRSAEWRAEGDLLTFWIEANAFMHNMNRALVGTMLEVAGGRRTVEDFAALLRGAARGRAGETAAAHGLHLIGVGYDGRAVLPHRMER